jgi:glycosyltransferase involved in cell wall biosynthesis
MMNKTKVLIVISNMEFGGAQRQIVELVNNINQNEFEVHVCSLSEYAPLAEQFNDNIPLHIIHKQAKFDFTVVFKLAKLIRKYRFNVIHSYLFDAEIAARLAGKLSLTKIKIVGSERNSNYTLKPIQKRAYRLTKNLVSRIIANSQSGADYNALQTKQPASKYCVVYNGVDTNRFKPQDKSSIREELGIPPDCGLIGMFASFKQQKNHPFLIEALKKVKEQGDKFKLLLVGDTLHGGLHGSDEYTSEVKKQINESGFYNDVIFLGNRDDIERIYPACDFTVLPSLFEGTPNVVLESMACAVPCIATNVSDNGRIIEHAYSGYIVTVGDVNSLAQYISTLLNHKDQLDRLSVNARKTMLDCFSSQKLAEKMCAVYSNPTLLNTLNDND